jgi:hypothetical protein
MRLPDPRRSRAVLLGTGSYSDPALPELPAIARNVWDLERLLSSRHGTRLHPGSCRCATDESDIAVLGELLAAAASEAEDLLVVYYAGHGVIGTNGELHLGLPQTCGERELVAWTALPFALIRDTVSAARAANRVIILDCCFSGRAVDAMSDVRSLVAGQLDVAGTYTLASSPANSASNAPSGAEHTAFTGELLRVLTHGVEGAPELLTLQTIYEELLRALPAKGLPRPEQRNTRTTAGLALAPNRRHVIPADPVPPGVEAARLVALGDIDRAIRHYRTVANVGDPPAMAELARLLDARGDAAQAALWYRKAAAAGAVAAMNWFGYHEWHLGRPADARTWFRRAADAGSQDAKNALDALDALG